MIGPSGPGKSTLRWDRIGFLFQAFNHVL